MPPGPHIDNIRGVGDEEEVVLVSLNSKIVFSHQETAIPETQNVHANTNQIGCFTLQRPSLYTQAVSNILWLPRASVSSDETGARVRRGLSAEKQLTLSACLRHYPKAIAWSMLLFLTVVMEAYGKSLISGFIAFPSFRQKYGQPKSPPPPLGDATTTQARPYEISPLWQMGLQNGAVGCEILGLLLYGYVSYAIGYRKTMLACLTWLCLAVLPAFFAPNIGVLLAAQALCGFPWGAIQTLAATYAAEVVPAAMRAYILSNVNMCWLVGQLVGTGVLRSLIHNTTEWSYRLPFALQWAWAVPLFLCVMFAPESPWWLIRHGRQAEAEQSLSRLSNTNHLNVNDAIAIMQHVNTIEKELNYGGSSYLDLFRGPNLRRTEISCITWSCQALCGATLTGYAPYFLEQAGFEVSKSFSLATGMYGVGIAGGMVSWVLVSLVGRRRLYLAGLVTSVAILTTAGILSVVLEGSNALNWLLGSLIIFMTCVYNVTIGPVCYIIVAEIPSTRLRVKTVALARVVYNLFTMVNNVVAPQMLNPTAFRLGGKSCFVYAATALLCLTWSYFRLPETRGLSYLELDLLFEKRAPAGKFAEVQRRLSQTAYISMSRAEQLRSVWHGWLAYS